VRRAGARAPRPARPHRRLLAQVPPTLRRARRRGARRRVGFAADVRGARYPGRSTRSRRPGDARADGLFAGRPPRRARARARTTPGVLGGGASRSCPPWAPCTRSPRAGGRVAPPRGDVSR
jgi:hypothetical protein